jgi:polysaccharide biosynthesis/export protein
MKLMQSGPKARGIDRWQRLPCIGAVLLGSVVAGCSGPPPVSHTVLAPGAASGASAVVSSASQTLSPGAQQMVSDQKIHGAYRLGADDIIAVSVYLHPELSSPQPGATAGFGGVLVTSDGTVALPLVGNINLNGLTIVQAQQKISAAYGAYINNPNVTVQLVAPQSLRYYLLGDFSTPGVKYPGHPLTLLDALSLGGSVNLANADLYQAYVVQNSQKIPVDFHALLVDGDLTQNITLDPGATIVIPPASTEAAFVFGAVGKPGAIPFQAGTLSLLQALSVADLDLPDYTSARLEQVHIIRAHGNSADFIVVDAAKILQGEALPFALQPGDVVFVPPTQVASWNQVLDMLIPSLTTISGVLNPFVSIKYLSQRNCCN